MVNNKIICSKVSLEKTTPQNFVDLWTEKVYQRGNSSDIFESCSAIRLSRQRFPVVSLRTPRQAPR